MIHPENQLTCYSVEAAGTWLQGDWNQAFVSTLRVVSTACFLPHCTFFESVMTRIAIIGSGPTGIYWLQGLIASKQPLSITIFEETPDAGKGTPTIRP